MNNRILNLLAIVTITTVLLTPLAINKEYVGGPFPTHSPVLKFGRIGDEKLYADLKDGCRYIYQGHKRWKWVWNNKDKNMIGVKYDKKH